MGADKLLMKYRGKSLMQTAIDLMSSLPVYEKIVVSTKERLDLAVFPPDPDIKKVINISPENGQSGSIKLGVENSTGTHYLFIMADQPKLTAEAFVPLFESAVKSINSIIFPVINGNPCSPVLFPAMFRDELLTLTGDMGGRIIRETNPEACCAIKPENPELFSDIDNADDFIALCL